LDTANIEETDPTTLWSEDTNFGNLAADISNLPVSSACVLPHTTTPDFGPYLDTVRDENLNKTLPNQLSCFQEDLLWNRTNKVHLTTQNSILQEQEHERNSGAERFEILPTDKGQYTHRIVRFESQPSTRAPSPPAPAPAKGKKRKRTERKPFMDNSKRLETAKTRERGACIQCRLLKERVGLTTLLSLCLVLKYYIVQTTLKFQLR
jgi:hypothetical protein